MHRRIPLVIPHTMMIFPGPHSKVGTISTNFLFFVVRGIMVGRRDSTERGRAGSKLYTISEANEYLCACRSGHLIEQTMLYRLV